MTFVDKSLAQVAGRNARRLRQDAGATLEQLATAVRPYGLRWSTGRVGDFEGGRVAPTLPTLFAVTLGLRDVTGKPVALVDLFDGSEDVAMNESVTVPLESLRAALSGKPVGTSTAVQLVIGPTIGATVTVDPGPAFSESDSRLMRNLGVEPVSAVMAMSELWGRPLSAERDARAGAGANAQRKGQITRQLKAELETALTEKTDSEHRGVNRGNR